MKRPDMDDENAIRYERCVLGCLLEKPELINEIECDLSADFLTSDHRSLWRAVAKLEDEGITLDNPTIIEESGVDAAILSDLIASGAVLAKFDTYVTRVREASQERRFRRLHEELGGAAVKDRPPILEQMQEVLTEKETRGVHHFDDIPDIARMQIPPVEYVVPALSIAKNTICLWTGADGDGKTYLAQAMALAVSRGDVFLGMTCPKTPVLYVDLENAGFVVQDRMQSLIGDGDSPTGLRFWGTWLELEQQPPHAGSNLLLTICKETKPLLILDPLRYFHQAEENDSTEMASVMQYLRRCASCGSAVVLLHHPAKMEGSTGRGSSAIRGACDLALLHTLDKESGLITLKLDKNRLGPSRAITLRADFEQGKFELTEAPYVTRRNDELDRVQRVIDTNPGITQNAIAKQSGMMKSRLVRLLKEGTGTRWRTENGKYGSTCYFACSPTCSPTAKSLFLNERTTRTTNAKPISEQTCSAVLSPLGENREQVCDGRG